jgi:hypothetical protein
VNEPTALGTGSWRSGTDFSNNPSLTTSYCCASAPLVVLRANEDAPPTISSVGGATLVDAGWATFWLGENFTSAHGQARLIVLGPGPPLSRDG